MRDCDVNEGIDEGDAERNHEMLGEHDGGTAESVADIRHRLVEQRSRARETGIGLLTIRRRTDNEPLGPTAAPINDHYWHLHWGHLETPFPSRALAATLDVMV